MAHLEEAYWDASPASRKDFLASALGTSEDGEGPIVLYFDTDRSGKRAKTKLLGGTMWITPIATEELLGVTWCREGDSNPHRV